MITLEQALLALLAGDKSAAETTRRGCWTMGDLGACRCAKLLCNQYGRKVTLVASSAPTIWTRLTPR